MLFPLIWFVEIAIFIQMPTCLKERSNTSYETRAHFISFELL